MGKWRTFINGVYEDYHPDIGEIIADTGGGVWLVTAWYGVLYHTVNANGTNRISVWDMRPATQDEKARLRAKLDVDAIPLDRTFQNAPPCGAIGWRERMRALEARLKRKVDAGSRCSI